MKISVCMMVKNEQEMLPRALKSVRWADEIVVVDTGSMDKTVEIAESFGAKVYHHPWEKNFSTHRNQSISCATGDWVCILDADEEVASDMAHFKSRLAKIPRHVSALVVSVVENRNGKDTTPWLGMRFFRKSSGIHYKYAVHNKAVFNGDTAGTDITFRHYGYSLPPEQMAKKHERTEELLMEEIKEFPDSARPYYYLTQTRIGQKRYKEAFDFGIKFFERIKVSPNSFQFYGVMYFFMSWASLNMRDGEKAYAWALKGLEYYPDDIDLNYTMGVIGYESKRDDILQEYGQKYLELYDKKDERFKDTGKFVNDIDQSQWVNRTIYRANESARKVMENLLNE